MIHEETYTLANGVTIPKLGLGTWLVEDGLVARVVQDAIEVGYRNIDTAQAYGNERGVGEGIRATGIARDELFVSTKVRAEIKNYDDAARSIEESLAKLDIGYIDLMLIHCPQPWAEFRKADYSEGNREVWRALEEAHLAGQIRAIGVSNFLEADLDNILEVATVAPTVNQIKLHVGETPEELLAYCSDKDILVQAYSPIAHGDLLDDANLAEVAARYGVTVPQLCIRYTLQLGAQSLPKTVTRAYMESNAELDFEISAEDMATLRAL